MGRAKITGGGPDALYNIEILKDPAGAVERIARITARLTELAEEIPAADALVATAETAVQTALSLLDAAINSFVSDPGKKDELVAAQKSVAAASSDLQTKRRYLSTLKFEKVSLDKEKAVLTAAIAAEPRSDVWCTDFSEELATGTEVGTMEILGEDTQIILTPGGSTSTALGKLRPTAVQTPSGWFYNKAVMPAWQKWKPTYRIGVLLTVDYEEDTCDLFIADARSREQGLLVNQTGTAYNLTKTAVSGWTDFASRNPTFPLVTNTANSTIPLTAKLRQDMESVQSEVNSRETYRLDTEQYGKLEYWSLMQEGGSGDCEDFALTKAKKLLDKGYSASAIHIEVGLKSAGVGHAWLVVQTSEGDYALDIAYKDVRKAYELPYTDRRRQTGMSWSNSGVKFSGVSIEYMDGSDSDTFLVGDRVVVEFTGQDWTKPKVIGYETNPRGPVVFEHFCRRFDPYSVSDYHRYIDGEWSVTPPAVYKITDKYMHGYTGGDTAGIYDKKSEALLLTVDFGTIWGVPERCFDLSYEGDAGDLKLYMLDGEGAADANDNLQLKINGVATGRYYSSIQYTRGKLYGVHGTKTVGASIVRGADRIDEMDRDGVLIQSIAISSYVYFEYYRDHIRYDSKNDCFYLYGNEGNPAWYAMGCAYTFYATVIEKYSSDWVLIYRRRIGAWCVTSGMNTIWQGEGWVVGQNFYTGMANTPYRYPIDHLWTDVYDDKLFVWKYVWGGTYWVASEIKTLDLIAYPCGAGIDTLPFGTWLEHYAPAPSGCTQTQLMITLRHHGHLREYSD